MIVERIEEMIIRTNEVHEVEDFDQAESMSEAENAYDEAIEQENSLRTIRELGLQVQTWNQIRKRHGDDCAICFQEFVGNDRVI